MPFIHTQLVNVDKSKQNNQNQGTLHFETAILRVLHERRMHCFPHRTPKTSRKVDFGGCPLDEL